MVLIMFLSVTFVSGQRVYDDRADIRIKGVGFGMSGHGMGLPGDADTVLISLLSGVPPDNSVQLDSSIPDVEAWKFKDSERERLLFGLGQNGLFYHRLFWLPVNHRMVLMHTKLIPHQC